MIVTTRVVRIWAALLLVGARGVLAEGPGKDGVADLPAFLKAGVRITYHAGDSVVQGVGSHLIEDPKGGWRDPVTGKTFADTQLRNSGGVGYHEVNVVHATRELVAADIRNYQIVDVQRDIASSASVGGVTGNAEKLGDYWVHPARLAAMGEVAEAGRKVNRVEFSAMGRTYKGLSIAEVTAGSYSRVVYDLESGLLLSRATSTVGENVKTIDPATGKVNPGRGAAVISHMLMVSVRELKIPWAGEPTPQWAKKGRRLDYQGGYALAAGAGMPPLPPYGMTLSFAFEGATADGVVTAKQLTRSEIGRGLPVQESTFDRCFSTTMLNGAWIGTAALQKMAPGDVVDQDPVTKFRTTFGGVRNNVATIIVQGPAETSELVYNVADGMLVGLRSSRQSGTGTGTVNTQLQLSGAR